MRLNVGEMAIGKGPREWYVELFALTGFGSSAAIAYSRGDLMLGIASVFILMQTIHLWRLQVRLSIGVTADS